MNEKYKNLAIAFNIFSAKYDLSFDQNISSLDLSIKNGYLDRNKLKEELTEAMNDPRFDWVGFAITNKLIIGEDGPTYSNENIKNYFKSLVWDYLYQE